MGNRPPLLASNSDPVWARNFHLGKIDILTTVLHIFGGVGRNGSYSKAVIRNNQILTFLRIYVFGVPDDSCFFVF